MTLRVFVHTLIEERAMPRFARSQFVGGIVALILTTSMVHAQTTASIPLSIASGATTVTGIVAPPLVGDTLRWGKSTSLQIDLASDATIPQDSLAAIQLSHGKTILSLSKGSPRTVLLPWGALGNLPTKIQVVMSTLGNARLLREIVLVATPPTTDVTDPPRCTIPASVLDALPTLNPDRGRWSASLRQVPPAMLVLDDNGNVLARPRSGIREDQMVRVTVLTTAARAARLSIRRASSARDASTLVVAGAPPAANNPLGVLETPPKVETCVVAEATIADFAPGEGKISLVERSATVKGEMSTLGEASLPVRRLYQGHVSVGLLRTSNIDPQFGLQERYIDSSGTSVARKFIVDNADSSKRVLPMVFLTAFFPGANDLDGPNAIRDIGWWLSPTIGFAPSSLTEQVFVGASTHLGRLLLIHYGLHFAKGKTLAGDSTVLSKPFAKDVNDIPTRTAWRTARWQMAISLDGSIISTFLNKAFVGVFDGWFGTKPKEAPAAAPTPTPP